MRAGAGAPSGTVTFLFTDLERSTELWEHDERGMRDALELHDAIVFEAVERQDGYVFATGGDGFGIAFASAASAVEAAVSIQRAVAASTGDGVQLTTRMGLHTGEAQERDGNYFGRAPNRAARVMQAAWGGQVLLSASTAALIDQATLVDLGEHHLRGLSRPERLSQLTHPELAGSFPSPRTLSVAPHNLPRQRTSFVGRDAMVDTVAGHIAAGSLLTLLGSGGVGKTRLAVETGGAILGRFDDGVWFCGLSAADDGAGVERLVANTLQVRQRPEESLLDSIVEQLSGQRALVILDNCEHVIEHAAEVADELLDGCPDLAVVATSREALAIDGERIVAVPPLAVDDRAGRGAAGMQLFVDRALANGVPEAHLDDDHVAEICRRLDGLPLAIELAAARAVALSPADIVGHLDERFQLLTGGGRRRPDRQRTLEAAVAWSHDLLDDDGRRAFRHLGVVADSFDLATAEALVGAAGLDPASTVGIIDRLVASSLLSVETGPGGETRYRYLETVRHYAALQLDRHEGRDGPTEALARHLAGWMEHAAAASCSPNEPLWLERVRLEVPNLRHLLAWAADNGHPQLAIDLLAPFATRSLHVAETLAPLAGELVESDESLLGLDNGARLAVLAARYRQDQLDYDRSKELATLAIDAVERDPVAAAHAYNVRLLSLINFAVTPEAHVPALDDARAGVALARRCGDDEALVHNLTGVSFCELGSGLGTGGDAAQEAYDVAAGVGSPNLVGVAAFALGSSLVALGRHEEALDRFDECQQRCAIDSFAGHAGRQFAAAMETFAGRPGLALRRIDGGIGRAMTHGLLPPVIGLAFAASHALHTAGDHESAALLFGANYGRAGGVTVVLADGLLDGLREALGPAECDRLVERGRELDPAATVRLVADASRPFLHASDS